MGMSKPSGTRTVSHGKHQSTIVQFRDAHSGQFIESRQVGGIRVITADRARFEKAATAASASMREPARGYAKK